MQIFKNILQFKMFFNFKQRPNRTTADFKTIQKIIEDKFIAEIIKFIFFQKLGTDFNFLPTTDILWHTSLQFGGD